MNRRNFNTALCKTAGSLIAGELILVPSFAQRKRTKQQPLNGSLKNSKQPQDPQNPKAGDDSKLFRDPDGDFTIVFPAEPRYELDQKNVSVTYFASVKDHVLGVIVGLKTGVTKWTQERIREIVSSFDEVINSRVTAPSILEVKAHVYSKESKYRYQELTLHSVLTQSRYYTLFTRAEFDVSTDTALAKNFFNSFKLTPQALARRQQTRPNRPQPTQVTCVNCKGTGKLTCYRCQGTGKGDYGDSVWWRRWCYGNGYQTCYPCNGTGKRWL